MLDGGRWVTPKAALEPFYVYRLYPNFENPQIRFDGDGVLNMVFRHWTRQRTHGIGAKLMWENFVTRFDGNRWSGADWLAHRKDRVTWRDHFVCSRDICLVGKTVVMPAGGRTVFLEDTGKQPACCV